MVLMAPSAARTGDKAALPPDKAPCAGRPRILTFLDHYVPGYRAGGPVQTIRNLTSQLGDEFHFLIATKDHDLGQPPYPGIATRQWCHSDRESVAYLSRADLRPLSLAGFVKSTRFDAYYLNSVFSRVSMKVILLRRLGLIPPRPVLIAPRGELSPGALSLKPWRKALYLQAARRVAAYAGVSWQASTETERQEILHALGGDLRPDVMAAVNLQPAVRPPSRSECPPLGEYPARQKTPGEARVVFLSRISPKKNLAFAARLLGRVSARAQVVFDVVGPVGDPGYWATCQAELATLPPHVTWAYRGPVEPEAVVPLLREYDALLLPTLGENYGHVYVEAWRAGCLVVTSDRTPWRDLAARQVGWDLSLDHPERFTAAVEELAALDEPRFRERSLAAVRFAHAIATDRGALEANRILFNSVLGRVTPARASLPRENQG